MRFVTETQIDINMIRSMRVKVEILIGNCGVVKPMISVNSTFFANENNGRRGQPMRRTFIRKLLCAHIIANPYSKKATLSMR